MDINDVPSVYPCVRRPMYEDKAVDHFEIVCDGRTHVNVSYKDGAEVKRSKIHDCDRWAAYANRILQLNP